jgi:hypothetical protein
VVLAVVFFGFVAFDVAKNGRRAKQTEEQLAAELANIPAPDGARLVDQRSGSKPRQAFAHRGYGGSFAYANLRQHYDAELRQRDWRFCGEKAGDHGRRTAYYCKGEYRAALEEAGEESKYGWSFALDMSWGLP